MPDSEQAFYLHRLSVSLQTHNNLTGGHHYLHTCFTDKQDEAWRGAGIWPKATQLTSGGVSLLDTSIHANVTPIGLRWGVNMYLHMQELAKASASHPLPRGFHSNLAQLGDSNDLYGHRNIQPLGSIPKESQSGLQLLPPLSLPPYQDVA